MSGFAGFSPAAFTFLDALAADNTKAFFDAHRDTYRTTIAEPCAGFVEELAPLLAERVHPGLRGEARVGRSLFRINRDTRFSADKTPYKTHLDFLFWLGGANPRTAPAAIMRITTTTVLTGAGRAGLRGDELTRHRDAVTGPDGQSLRDTVDTLIAGGSVLSDADRARVPSGYPADHPNADLLRRDGFHLTHTVTHPSSIGEPTFPAWVTGQFARYRDLLAWFARAAG